MQMRGVARIALLGLVAADCGGKATAPSEHADAAIKGGIVGCAAGFSKCKNVCCGPGMLCTAGTCKYPYSTARLYVYLCQSFNAACHTDYFALDEACSRITATSGGTCYDTGFDISAGQSYQLTTCTTCGGACGASVGFQTPGGFLEPKYFPSQTWWCGNDKCQAPTDCGGRAPADGGASH